MAKTIVYTLCLNPSFDVTLWSDRLDFEEPCGISKERVYPGGKAINVSRVLTKMSIENKAYCLAGHESATKFSELLKKDGVICNYILTNGNIRENVLVVFPENKSIKLNRQGFKGGEKDVDKLAKKIINDIQLENFFNEEPPIVVMAGSLPSGISKDMYKALALRLKKIGARIVLDTDLFTVNDLKEIKPYIIKPNEVEITHLAGKDLITINDVVDFSKELTEYVDYVLVSLGKNGLVCVTKDISYHVKVPSVEVKSTVGAGDTTLSAFISATIYEETLEDRVKLAAACGTAAVTTDGTGIITKQKAEQMLKKVKVSIIN